MLNRHDDVIPIPGTSSAERLAENAAAADIQLSAADLERIESVAPKGVVAGNRYNEQMMTLLNG